MGQRAPTFGQIAIAVAFAFSCFGLLLFLWSAFGGPVPLKPEGYQVKIPFDEATTLAEESDVRLSGVSVGKVKEIELSDEGETKDLAVATIEIDDSYAPLPNDTLATLRQKTLLGETYVELSPGDDESGTIEEGGDLPPAQVGESVQLDEIFRTFDPQTRANFQIWMQQAAVAFAGRGADLSAAIANLEPLAEDANKLLRVLDTDEQALSQFINNTGVVFSALSERQGQLQGLIRNSGTVFATTAKRDEELRETFIALPTFLDESKATLTRLEEFSNDTDPLITQLRPSARELSGTLKQVARVSPDLKGFMVGLRKVGKRSKTALPAVQRLLDTDLPPVFTALDPFTRQLTPIAASANRYKREITALLGNATAAINGEIEKPETPGNQVHYLRTTTPISPEALAIFPDHRLQTNRANAYTAPGEAGNIGNLNIFDIIASGYCMGAPGVNAELDQAITVGDADFDARATFDTPQELFDMIKLYSFGDQNRTDDAGFPTQPCTVQAPQQSIGDIPEMTDYLHVYQQAP
jgi:phospholipid/cholesterol/gamma-HCH transport system substrate-binding protein